jgi:CO dehydrogenase nickel-insertion accessory protein CooC1
MDIKVKQWVLVINRLRREALPQTVASLQAETGASLAIALPDDDELSRLSERGDRLQALPRSNPVVAGIDRLVWDAGVPTLSRAKPGYGT